MVTREDIEDFLARLGDTIESFDELEEGLWVLSVAEDEAKVVVNYTPPVVVLRVNIMDVPEKAEDRLDLMTKLLELNATELIHGSYGLEGNHVVLTDAHQLEDLDFGEFQASFDSITMALASHMPALAKPREA